MEGELSVTDSRDEFMSDSSRYLMHASLGLKGLFGAGLDELPPKSRESLQSLCDELLAFLYPDQGELLDAPDTFSLAIGMLEASRDLMKKAPDSEKNSGQLRRMGRVLSELNPMLVLMSTGSRK